MSEYDIFAPIYDFEYDELVEDIPFYVEQAKVAGDPVLELGCGTGRVLIPVARAGVEVVGLDASPAMLQVCREKVAGQAEAVRQRVTLVEGDMRDFDLGREQFSLVYIPFRAFLHLLTVEDQLAALTAIRRALRPSGRLVIAFFDPRLDYIAARLRRRDATAFLEHTVDLFGGERLLQWSVVAYETLTQVMQVEFIYDRVAADGKLTERVYRHLTMRWIYRYEAEHLWARAGFVVEALYGDFNKRPFEKMGDEQIWVLQPRMNGNHG